MTPAEPASALRSPNTQVLTLALPKGRLLKPLARRLAAIGAPESLLDERDRRLVRDATEPVPFRVLLLKPDDVPTYVEYGAAHLGVVGRDVLLERGSDVLVPLDLGLGRCRMVVAGPRGRPERELDARARIRRVATKYPRIATAHFAARGEEVEVVYVGGSVEIAPQVGLADWIVDLVETGETLAQNGLAVREAVCDVSAVVVANRVEFKLRSSEIATVLAALAQSSDVEPASGSVRATP